VGSIPTAGKRTAITEVADHISMAENIIEIGSSLGIRCDLVGDGHNDATGERLWTLPRHDILYEYPDFDNKSELVGFHGAVTVRDAAEASSLSQIMAMGDL